MANTNPIKTYCNEGCQRHFTITKMPTMKVKQNIEKTYFRCPHCKREYISYYSSDVTKKLQEEMRKLQNSIRTIPNHNVETLDGHWKAVDELKAKIKQSMAEARLIAES